MGLCMGFCLGLCMGISTGTHHGYSCGIPACLGLNYHSGTAALLTHHSSLITDPLPPPLGPPIMIARSLPACSPAHSPCLPCLPVLLPHSRALYSPFTFTWHPSPFPKRQGSIGEKQTLHDHLYGKAPSTRNTQRKSNTRTSKRDSKS